MGGHNQWAAQRFLECRADTAAQAQHMCMDDIRLKTIQQRSHLLLYRIHCAGGIDMFRAKPRQRQIARKHMGNPIDLARFGPKRESVTNPIGLGNSDRCNDKHLVACTDIFLYLVVDENSRGRTVVLMLGNNQNFHTQTLRNFLYFSKKGINLLDKKDLG